MVWVFNDKFGKENRLMSWDEYVYRIKSSGDLDPQTDFGHGTDYVFWDGLDRGDPVATTIHDVQRHYIREYPSSDSKSRPTFAVYIRDRLKKLEGMRVYYTGSPGQEYTVEKVYLSGEVDLSRMPTLQLNTRTFLPKVHSGHLVPTWECSHKKELHKTRRPKKTSADDFNADFEDDKPEITHCPHCTVEFPPMYSWNHISCNVCGLPLREKEQSLPLPKMDDLSKALEASLKDQKRTPTDAESDKIMLGRERLLHLADIVQDRLVSDEFANDPAEHFIRLRSSELDLQTCWEILQKFDPNALEWLTTTRAWGLVMERFAVEPPKEEEMKDDK